MLERFQGDAGKRLRVGALLGQRLVAGNAALAEELADIGELSQVTNGQVLIEQGGTDNDLYLIITGLFEIVVNATVVRQRGPGFAVGEMAAINPIQKRSATVPQSTIRSF
ncbi:cyclic nucleotide-binding domain-containing protein [Paraburkholderia hospita]|uniref:cyclic nucleotide-binding domain-containing protein n=1 Tax=Paraburkholderia hospita TaxID=169430 RepID=UPI003ECFF74C